MPSINQVAGPSLTIGGRVFTDLKNLIRLNCFATGTSTVRSTARLDSASSGYAVPAGKSLRILAARFRNGGGTLAQVAIGYADNDVGITASTALTNGVFASGSSTVGTTVPAAASVAFAGLAEASLNFVVPTGKYPVMQKDTASNVDMQCELYGYLE